MSVICPTVLASDPHAYREQLEKVIAFSDRIQVDLMDGIFSPAKSINPIQAWWPDGIHADVHLMFQKPAEHIETLVSLKPHMVIIHAEAEGDLAGILQHYQKLGINAGVALLKSTTVESAKELIEVADHVLIFSGDLGHFGGIADITLLQKVKEIQQIHPGVEIGWDGGASEENVAELSAGGIDVINVGGAIQRSQSPQRAYDTLVANISTT